MSKTLSVLSFLTSPKTSTQSLHRKKQLLRAIADGRSTTISLKRPSARLIDNSLPGG